MVTLNELEKQYVDTHKKSQKLYEQALEVLPGGVSHDSRFRKPFPIYARNAAGSKKWDVDGNEYVDLVMGHGALLFGYGEEKVVERLSEQIKEATHIGACSEYEIEWAKLIQQLIPSARNGLVRGTSCGTEAVAMGIRLSRAYTDKNRIIIHLGAYHGKIDTTIIARSGPPIKTYNVKGIPEGVMKDVAIVPFNNLQAVRKELQAGDVACILLHSNALYEKEYVKGLRELSTEYDAVFFMDEVVSGCRYSAGGAQEYYGVTPDLTALGKIIGGGVPVGAICGNKDIMDYYSFKDENWNKYMRISVGGTWNCQPISIIGGIEMMKKINTEKDRIYPKIRETSKKLCKSFNEQAEDLGVSAYAYGLPVDNPTTFSINLFNKMIPEEKKYLWKTGPRTFDEYKEKSSYRAESKSNQINYLSMINDGIFSYGGLGGSISTAHTNQDADKILKATENSLRILKENKLIGGKHT
jgi:glutamate-1-semialdehyde 2,1-aminomutase